VSKLLFALLIPACFTSLATSAMLPQFVGTLKQTAVKPLPIPLPTDDKAVWDDYGLQDSEQATYENAGQKINVRAYRLQDTTGAVAAFQWLRPQGSTAPNEELAELSPLSAITANGLIIALGNHVLIVDGAKPSPEDLGNVFRSMPRQESGPLPSLPNHVPAGGLIPNSERYITGPGSLAKFEPEVSPSQAAFHLGTEIQTATYKTANGEMRLAIFSMPSPELARIRLAELEKIPGLLTKRSGPLVAAIYQAKDANDAEKLLSQVRFQAAITTSQAPANTKKENFGDFLLNLAILIGIVIIFAVVSGLAFGGIRHMRHRGGASGDREAVISLHLGDQ
jgi:hypothetical protein